MSTIFHSIFYIYSILIIFLLVSIILLKDVLVDGFVFHHSVLILNFAIFYEVIYEDLSPLSTSDNLLSLVELY